MSLDALCREIAATADARAAAAMREAASEAQRTLEEARAAAAKMMAASREEGEGFARAEVAERTNAAQLEASKLLSEAREEAVRVAVADVWEKFRQMPRRPGYAKKLRQWAEQAQTELGISDALLRANASDLAVLSEAGFKVNRVPIDCAGGVRAESRDGRICVDLTLEAQFDHKREEVGREAFARLFADEEIEGEAQGKNKSAKTASKSGARAAASRLSAGSRKKASSGSNSRAASRARAGTSKMKPAKRGRR